MFVAVAVVALLGASWIDDHRLMDATAERKHQPIPVRPSSLPPPARDS